MNKISEKAVWDDLVPSDDEKLSSPSYGQPIQPQMMFCYKCSQVIPANSAFCPWCQTELFVSCPKCGSKYSSQYPSCNQCGTNRESYILEQQKLEARRIEEERRKEVKRQQLLEEQRRKEAENEARRREEERLRAIQQEEERRKCELADKRNKEREAYKKRKQKEEDARIRTTAEYKEAYEFLSKLGERVNSHNTKVYLSVFIPCGIFIILAPIIASNEPAGIFIILAIWTIYMFVAFIKFLIPKDKKYNLSRYKDLNVSSISNPLTLRILQYVEKYSNSLDFKLEDTIVKAYRECGGPVLVNSSSLQNAYVKNEVPVNHLTSKSNTKIRCGNCGFSSTFTEIPSVCPLCGAPSIVFEKI